MSAGNRLSRKVVRLIGLGSVLMGASVQGETVEFAALLDGECAGTGVSAKGWGAFNLDTITGELNYIVNFDASLDAVFAHIHVLPDACGNVPSGPIIVNFNPSINPMVGTETLAPEHVEEIRAGNTYFNIHTHDFPDGEIAGVLYPIPKSRYVSFFPDVLVAGATAATQAIRVGRLPAPPLHSLGGHSVSSGVEVEYRWVGEPGVHNDVGGPNPTFRAAAHQCTPEFRSWDAETLLLHVYGGDIVPNSVYEVQYVEDTCPDLDDPGCYSDPVRIRTAHWGDVVEPYAERAGGQPDFGDISTIVAKFSGTVGAPILTRADLVGGGTGGEPSLVDRLINFSDVSAGIGAFSGLAYPFALDAPCP